MAKKAFDKIAAGLNEALAIMRGEEEPARLYLPAEQWLSRQAATGHGSRAVDTTDVNDTMHCETTKLRVSQVMAKAEDKMTLVRLRKEAQLTLPASVRRALNLEEGDYLEAEIVKEGVLLKPLTIARRKEAWGSVLKTAGSVKDTRPKAKRDAAADEAEIVREIKAHRRGDA